MPWGFAILSCLLTMHTSTLDKESETNTTSIIQMLSSLVKITGGLKQKELRGQEDIFWTPCFTKIRAGPGQLNSQHYLHKEMHHGQYHTRRRTISSKAAIVDLA